VHWLQDPEQSSVDDHNNESVDVRKRRQHLKGEINEVEINSKNKNTRGLCRVVSELKKSYERRTRSNEVYSPPNSSHWPTILSYSPAMVYKQRYGNPQPDHCSLRMETEWVSEMSEIFKN
jgi:hypothetical protein